MNFEYSPFAHLVRVVYRCPECGEETEMCAVPPSPDFSAESHSSSIMSDVVESECENCGCSIEFILSTGIYGGDGYCDDLSAEDVVCIEIDDGDDFDSNNSEFFISPYFCRFENSMDEIIAALDSVDDNQHWAQTEFFAKLCYSNVIACMEAYLADSFIAKVTATEASLRNFTETYEDFKSQKFTLQDLYNRMDFHRAYVVQTLREVIFHNLGRVKGMFKETLGVDLGDLNSIIPCVLVRHDIVHRNGKDKEGNDRHFTKQMVFDLIAIIRPFVENIEAQLEVVPAQ